VQLHPFHGRGKRLRGRFPAASQSRFDSFASQAVDRTDIKHRSPALVDIPRQITKNSTFDAVFGMQVVE
jgi:hypothetical protein